MPVKTIYIARHGFRLNWSQPYWKSITGLAKDPPLSVYGETQARELAAHLANLPENERPTAIFTSPYYRCIQTSLPIADALSLPIYVEFGLSEWYSPVTPGTGIHPRPARVDDLLQYFPRPTTGTSAGTTNPETAATTNTNANANANANANGSYIDPRWKPTYLVTRKGESVAELYARCEEFLRVFIGRVEDPASHMGCEEYKSECDVGVGVGHERILLVSHAGTIIGLARALTGDEEIERRVRVGCCTLTTLHRSPSSSPSSSSSSSSPSSTLTLTSTSPSTSAAVAASASSLSPSVPSSGPPPPPPPPPSVAARDVIGKGVWTVHGTPADGSFLAGGVERSWGMEDVKTHEGVVVEDAGTPGSEGEEDGPNGVQVWWRAGVPSPRM